MSDREQRVYRVQVPMNILVEFKVPANSPEEAVRLLDDAPGSYDCEEISEASEWAGLEEWQVDGRCVADEPWFRQRQQG
jgi:hypothetical protein